MGNQHTPVDVDPQALKQAQEFWCKFTHATKYVVVAIIGVLGLMALFLVH